MRDERRAHEPATVLMLAHLQRLRRERGLPSVLEIEVPVDGVSAGELAATLGLPPDAVEGLFLNHVKSGLEAVLYPGDRVAFVPYGTPASHPAFFGPFADIPR